MDDFVAFCVACGCGVKTPNSDDAYETINDEDFHVMGRFSTKAQGEFFQNNVQGPKARVDQETRFFTAMANPCWDEGTKVNLQTSQLQFHYWPLYQKNTVGNRSFPIHTSCLQILDQYIGSNLSQPKTSESVLQSREWFYNTICKHEERNEIISDIDSCHTQSLLNHPGATITYPGNMWRLAEGEQWDASWTREVRSEDPIEIDDLIRYVRHHLGFPPHGPHRSQDIGTSHNRFQDLVERYVPALQIRCFQSKLSPTAPSNLERLPTELLEHIMMHLPVTCILVLRRSSKRLYSVIPLDNAFWRRVLLSNRLFGFTWDLDSQMSTDDDLTKRNSTEALKWDWPGLAKALSGDRPIGKKGSLSLNEPRGLSRRRNVWNNLKQIEQTTFQSLFGDNIPITGDNY